eukprot:TRINITY_DN33830_c0_g1_i1.p5 TRINITY_DN33830_c0_g1~~TRINITY_DN33830_c0_g1_i1.p5  ORF type:complete len:104 (+),score=4.55 TRINITY_DN33830_c0_g1_i1:577-888(+)
MLDSVPWCVLVGEMDNTSTRGGGRKAEGALGPGNTLRFAQEERRRQTVRHGDRPLVLGRVRGVASGGAAPRENGLCTSAARWFSVKGGGRDGAVHGGYPPTLA